MLDLWLDQESQIEKTAAQQFEELAEKIAVEGGEPGPGLEPVKPDGHKWESSNYSEEVRTPEAADQLLKRELTGRVVDEVPKTDVQQTPPRAVNTVNGRAEDRIPLVEKLKKAAADEHRRQLAADIGIGGGLAAGGALGGMHVQRVLRDARVGKQMRKAISRGDKSFGLKVVKGRKWPAALAGAIAGAGLYGSRRRQISEAMREKAAAYRLEKEGRAKWRAALEAGGGEAKRLLDAGAFVGSGRAMSMSRGRAPRAAGAIAKAQDQLSRMPEILRKNMRGMEPSPEIVRRHRGRLKRKLYLDAFKPNRERATVSSIGKTSSLKEAMVKAASDGKVRTLEGWGSLTKSAAKPITALPIDKAEEIRQARLAGGVGGGAIGLLGGGTLGSAIGSVGGHRGRVIGGLVGALGGTGLGAYLGGRHSRMAAEATPEEVFQARANLREAEDRYGRGELEDKSRLLATLMAANETMRRTGRKGISSDYLARDRPGSFVPDRAEYEFGNSRDLFGRGGTSVRTRYRRIPREE